MGKSTTQVGRDKNGEFTSGDGEVYDKWSQAVASAFDMVSDSDEDFKKNDHKIALSIIIPVIVLNEGALWVADYSADGVQSNDPKKVDSCEMYLGKTLWTGPMRKVEYNISPLHILTLLKFEGYLDRLMVNDNYWNLLFPIDEIRKQIEKK